MRRAADFGRAADGRVEAAPYYGPLQRSLALLAVVMAGLSHIQFVLRPTGDIYISMVMG